MERYCYEVFPERGNTTTHRWGFGGAVSVLLFRFDLWLKGDPIRQIRKSFKCQEDDEDTPRHSAHHQHARHKAKADLAWAKGDKRSHGHGGIRGPSAPRVASPTPPSTEPALTPAAAAAAIAKALDAKRDEVPVWEWKRGWGKWEVQRRKEGERLRGNKEIVRESYETNVDNAPVSPRTPLRMPPTVTIPREKRGEKQENGLPTPPASPPSSRSPSELTGSFPWALSPHPLPPLPWASRLYCF